MRIMLFLFFFIIYFDFCFGQKSIHIYSNDFEGLNLGNVVVNGLQSKSTDQFLNLSFQYSKGNKHNRFARVVSDPLNIYNNVLEINITSTGREERQRVQASFSSAPDLKDIRHTVRVYFSPDFKYLKQYEDSISWLVLAEWWNSAPKGWNTPNVFRISVRLVKDKGVNNDLYFKVDAQSITYSKDPPKVGTGAIFKTEWEEVNRAFRIAYGKWLDFEYHVRAGDNEKGLFYMSVTLPNGEKNEIFDLKCATQSLNFLTQKGYNFWSPIKLYTSNDISDFMFDNQKCLQIFFDDLNVWRIFE